MPSIESVKCAMQTYGHLDGISDVFVNDDGLDLLILKEGDTRLAFHWDNGALSIDSRNCIN